MRYSSRPTGSKPAKYSLSVANAQAKARKRGEAVSSVTLSGSSSVMSTLQKLSTQDEHGGASKHRYKNMADGLRPKIYRSRPRGGSGYDIAKAGKVDEQWDTVEGPTRQHSTTKMIPVTGNKRQRSPDYEGLSPAHTTSPNIRKKIRYASPEHPYLDRFITPVPLQDTNPGTRFRQTPRISLGTACYPSSPLSQQGPRMSTFSTRAAVTTPFPARLASYDITKRLPSSAHKAGQLCTMDVSPCPATRIQSATSPAMFKRPGPLYSMADFNRPRYPAQAHQTRLGGGLDLPYGQPYIRTHTLPDHGRKAVAMSFQPTMPVIKEESPAPAYDQVSSPCLLSPHSVGLRSEHHYADEDQDLFMPQHAQYGLNSDQHDVTEIYRYETPQPTIPFLEPASVWRARHHDIISSQSTASHDENRKPSEDQDSVGSFSRPIFAPKAHTGIDIDASEAAARSPSLDVDPSDLSLGCAGEGVGKVPRSDTNYADHRSDHKVIISESTLHAVDAGHTVEVVKLKKVGPPQNLPRRGLTSSSSASSKTVASPPRLYNNRPKPRQRNKLRPKVFNFDFRIAQEGNCQALSSASDFIPHKSAPFAPVSQGRRDMADDEMDTILSFGEDVAEDAVSEKLSDGTSDGTDRYSYTGQGTVGKERPDEELESESAVTNQDETYGPGFEIWRDESV